MAGTTEWSVARKKAAAWGTAVAVAAGDGVLIASESLGPGVPDPIKDENVGDSLTGGTYQGDMVAAMLPVFRRIVTIELDPELARAAVRRFHDRPEVEVVQGDAGRVLDDVLARIDERCAFWLDGHYSGPGTALGSRPTPILAELAAIARHRRRDHLILLAQDADYQARQIARLPFSSPAEREKLRRDIAQAQLLYPAGQPLPPEVGQPPRLGIPDLDEGIGGLP